ncbi:helix-turn-helix domain-containing protein [Sulfurospirillum cavolei]|uniref:helix-turn-helix domain-containing protein n=1 Tax=Sulfurospirillum cavolei TaxID=366522 RepID=UPI003FA2DFEA
MKEIVFGDTAILYKRIGKNVAKIRKAKGISQLDLALAIGLKSVGLISVAEIYHNKKHFNIEHLDRIATILEVDICEFFKP